MTDLPSRRSLPSARADERHPEPELIEISFRVPPDRHGWRLDRFLHDRIPRLSRSKIRRVIAEEAFRSETTGMKPSRAVKEGEIITLHRPPPEEPPCPESFDVAFDDGVVIVIDKPAGLPVHPSARYHRRTLTWLLRRRFGDERPVLAHRLDRETSGLLLCAWSKAAESSVKKQFEARSVDKLYLAIVRGAPREEAFTIDVPLGPAEGSEVRIRMGPRDDADGLPARTDVTVLERLDDCALVAARPLTGRQHQIRAHLSAVGHPVVGDKIYGADEGIFIELVERGPSTELLARLELPRHALHAHRLEFTHPTEGRRVEVTSPLPEDMTAYLAERRR